MSDSFSYAVTGSARTAETAGPSFVTGLILNQMAYKAGRNTRVSTVPPKVPPINVYASVPQKTEWVSGMNASTAASAVTITGRERCTVASTTASNGNSPSFSFVRICPIRMSVLRVRIPESATSPTSALMPNGC